MFSQGFTVSGSSLRLLKHGERGVVTRLKGGDDSVTQKLRAMGITPGTLIEVEQRFPRFVIKVGGNRMAIDNRIIESVYVRVNACPIPRVNKSITRTNRKVAALTSS